MESQHESQEMKKHDKPLLSNKDDAVGTFGNKTNKISEIRDILLGGDTLKEKKTKKVSDKKRRLDE